MEAPIQTIADKALEEGELFIPCDRTEAEQLRQQFYQWRRGLRTISIHKAPCPYDALVAKLSPEGLTLKLGPAYAALRRIA